MEKCDCLVEVDDVDMTPGGIMTKYVIRYCPLHAHAEELREALDRIMKIDNGSYQLTKVLSPEQQIANKALALCGERKT